MHTLANGLPVAVRENTAQRLATLFDTHHDRLYRLARRLVPSADDALDLVQETFLRAANSSKPVPLGKAKEEAWLVRVLINIRRDQWRKREIRSRLEWKADDGPRNGPDPESALIAKASVWRALDGLPPRRRAIVVMHELEGLSEDAIASLLGITRITVRWHLSAGRRDLSKRLQ